MFQGQDHYLGAFVDFFWVAVIIGALIIAGAVVVGILIVRSRIRGTAGQINYKVIYRIGVMFTPLGIVIMIFSILLYGFEGITIGLPIFVMGVIYLLVGLLNADKWKK